MESKKGDFVGRQDCRIVSENMIFVAYIAEFEEYEKCSKQGYLAIMENREN